MKRAALLAALLVAAASATAAGFAPLSLQDAGETCYSWNGGNFSAGSFSKCQPVVVIAQAAPAPPPPPAPVLINNVCPPQVILEPEPRKRIVHRKPRPKTICKPATP